MVKGKLIKDKQYWRTHYIESYRLGNTNSTKNQWWTYSCFTCDIRHVCGSSV